MRTITSKRVAIIGGGAAGLMAAIIAARKGAKVTIFERNDKLGRKLLVTGNGKCNFTNLDMQARYFRSNSINSISSYLEKFDEKDAMNFFYEIGMNYKDKAGYLYPATNQAQTILDSLIQELKNPSYDIDIKLNAKVSNITYISSDKIILKSQKMDYEFERVIMATGSKALPKSGSDGTGYYLLELLGYKMIDVVPALVQLKTKEGYFKKISGVRADAKVSLQIGGKVIAQDVGEVQFIEEGLSGIPIFQISRYVGYGLLENKEIKVLVDFFSESTPEEVYLEFISRKRNLGHLTILEFLSGFINNKIARVILELCNLKEDLRLPELSEKDVQGIVAICKGLSASVVGTRDFDAAQVCAGGLSMQEVTDKLELIKYPGIYVVGEVLDIDGICGGYNLQWAWTSAFVAGQQIV